jgi:urease accessory protein
MTDTGTATDASLLRLIWLASPALPVGGFSYSEGLEAAVDAGLVIDETTAGDWLVDQLHVALAPSDLAVVVQALPAWRADAVAAIESLDAWVLRTRETSELRLQSVQMGRSLGDWQASLASRERIAPQERAWTYPVAFARAAAASDVTPRQAALAFAFGWAENMVQAAVKAVPLGQSAGQRILARLAQEIPHAVDRALQAGEGRQAFAPMLAILSARHETQYSRLFRS